VLQAASGKGANQAVAATTGVALIVVDAAGDNMITLSPGANGRLRAQDARCHEALFDSASAVLLPDGVPRAVVVAAGVAARRAESPVVLNAAPVPDAVIPAELEQLVLIGPSRKDVSS